jgi:PAS domain S-box-containing protein
MDTHGSRGQAPRTRQLDREELVQKLELSLWAAGLAWWDYDLDTRRVDIHPRKAEMIGFTAEEAGEGVEFWIGRIHPDEREQAVRAMRGHISGELPAYDVQYRLRCKNGEYRWFWDRGRVVERDDNGDPARVTGIVQDIHDYKIMEQSLRESEQGYRFLAQNIVDLVWTADKEGNFTYVSPSSVLITGHTPEEMLKARWEDLVSDSSRNEAERKLAEIIRRGPGVYDYPIRLEMEQLRKDGSMVWTEVLFRVLTDDHGRIKGFVGVTRDIEERKRSEMRLRQLSAKIISAQEAERGRIGRELHDSIGAGLAGIRMQAEAALRTLPGDASKKLREALDNIDRAASENIVELRRVIMDLRPTVLDDFGLRAALDWLCRKCDELYDLKVLLTADIKEEELSDIQKTVLFRLAQESLHNAARHSGAGSAELTLERLEDRLRLQVADRGSGFDPSKTGEGMGITGMRERLQSLDGELEIDSAPGRGARLTARMPLNPENAAA